jgi:NADPH:quinone reductase-like Zn-dependent oxidoreductase
MRAMVHHRFGSASAVLQLEDVPKPAPAAGELLVRVKASSANPYDWHFIKGQPYFIRLGPSGLRRPKQPVPGGDFAGVVEALGDGDTGGFAVGDEVYGFQHGAFAEYLAVAHGRLARKPAGLRWEEAAALPLAGATAWQGLRDEGGLVAGQRVLIVGASGGIGTLAVQMAKAWGAHVTGVCSDRHMELVRSLGADEVIDYTRDDYTRSGERWDLVFQLGGTEGPRAIRRVLSEDGTLVQCAGDGDRFLGPGRNVIVAMAMNRFVSQRLTLVNTREDTPTLDAIREMVEAGELRVILDSTVPFEEAGFAVELVETGSPGGKVAISGVE